MNEPERLVDGLDPEVASLLRSAEIDTPPSAAEEQRRIRALGWASLATMPPARSASRNLLRRLSWVGWVGIATTVVTIGAVGARGAGWFSSAVGSSTSSDVARNRAVVDATNVASPSDSTTSDSSLEHTAPSLVASADSPAAMPSLRVDELPSAAPSADRAAPVRARRDAAPNVDDELKIIDSARGALATQPALALSHVQRYHATFSTPHFVDEADAIEVQALAALGRTDEARAKAEHFLQAHPNSPYTQRVRSAGGLRVRNQ